MFKVGAINGYAPVSVFFGVFAILGVSSPSYASTIVENDFTTSENTTLVVPAPGVAAGETGSIFFYQFGSPSTGSFSGLTTFTFQNPPNPDIIFSNISFDGSFTFVPQPNFTGTVNFIVQGFLNPPCPDPFCFAFNGTNALTDHIEVTGPTSATPLPAALPLFASGLGALGLLGWRRRRKVQALAA